VDRDLERRALQFYAQKIREGSDELYYHYRFYETHFMLRDLDDEDELLRIATLRIFKSDPYAYAGTFPFSVDLLNETEIEEIAASITFGGDEGAATLLRGQLWADAAGHGDDRAAFAERAVAELEAVPDDLRSHDYWGKLASCYRKLDYEKFKSVVPTWLASQKPERLPFDLINALVEAGRKEDWPTYDEWRGRWDTLPQNASFCDCYFNQLATLDGLRALHDGDVAKAGARLEASTRVRGCPHLNSGGPSLKLVSALADRGRLAAESEAYLDFCDRMAGEREETAELRARLRGTD
jgi:hypothetical protein